MTKDSFITLWARIEPVVTKPVNGEIAIDCDCEFVNYCSGYQLNVRPKCLLWPSEMMFLLATCELLCCCASCDFETGSIQIY